MKKTLVTFVFTVITMLGLGIIVLASASTNRSLVLYHSPYSFFYRQLMWLGVAFVFGLVAMKFDYHLWSKLPALTWTFYAAVFLMLAAVVCPGIRVNVNGSYRWLSLGPLHVQPSEFAKLAIVLVLAMWMDKAGWRVRSFFKGAFLPGVFIALYVACLLAEPDFGATMVVGVAGAGILFATGVRIIHLFVLGALGVPPVVVLVLLNPNRMARIKAWVLSHSGEAATVAVNLTGDAARKAESAAYQVKQSIIAIQNGGLWGVGLNNSVQKYAYLPEAHTDFIFSIGAEELGYCFSIAIVVLYVILLVCGTLISMRAPDRLGKLIAFGMTLLLAYQAAFNIGVVTGCLPTKGLALPFISYGGTNLISALFAVGTLINIGLHVDAQDEKMHTQLARNALKEI